MIIDEKNEPWFKAKDIAEILEYKDTPKAIKEHSREKHRVTYKETKVGKSPTLQNIHPQTTFINEAGLYSLIMKSTMKLAEDFQDWVTEEVLPSIRKSGEYKLQKEKEQLTIDFQNKLKIEEEQKQQLTLELQEEKSKN